MYYQTLTFETPYGYIEIVSRDLSANQENTKIEFRAVLTTPLKRPKRKSFALSGYKTGQYAEAADSAGMEYLIFFARNGVRYVVYEKKDKLSEMDFLFYCVKENDMFMNDVHMFEWQKPGADGPYLHRSNAPARVNASEAPIIFVITPEGRMIGRLFYKEEYYLEGKLHRPDGPAVIAVSEDKSWLEFWYKRGRHVSKEEIDEIFERHELNPDWRHWTDAEKVIVRLALS